MGKYDDIIDLEHHRSQKHPPMPEGDRAAQFAPFAALTGYGEAIDESVRMTETWTELTEEEAQELDRRLKILLRSGEETRITRFVPDARKTGGSYETIRCRIRRIEEADRVIITEAGERIPMDRVKRVECPAFDRDRE